MTMVTTVTMTMTVTAGIMAAAATALMAGSADVAPRAARAAQTADAAQSQSQLQSQLPGTRRTDLQRHDLSVPGREVVQVRVDFDPGFTAPKHTHCGEEIIYVIEGTLEYQVEGRPPTTYKAGDVLIVPYGVAHSVTNIGSGNGAELATYVVEKGKPLITLVK